MPETCNHCPHPWHGVTCGFEPRSYGIWGNPKTDPPCPCPSSLQET